LLSGDQLAARFPKLWRTSDAAKAWLRSQPVTSNFSKGGNAIRSICMGKAPFEAAHRVAAWRLAEFRPAGRCGGRPSRALVRVNADPATAIAGALGVEPTQLTITE
jgi:hypothetical protein